MASTLNLFRLGPLPAVFVYAGWLHRLVRPLWWHQAQLRVILEHPFGTAKQKSQDNDGHEHAGDRPRHKPSVELKSDDEDDNSSIATRMAKMPKAKTPEMAAMIMLNTRATAVTKGVC